MRGSAEYSLGQAVLTLCNSSDPASIFTIASLGADQSVKRDARGSGRLTRGGKRRSPYATGRETHPRNHS
jgi:hypothetical protein